MAIKKNFFLRQSASKEMDKADSKSAKEVSCLS